MKKNKEFKNFSKDELLSKIIDLKKELFNLRFQAATKQLTNPMNVRKIKYLIAHAKTLLTQKEKTIKGEKF